MIITVSVSKKSVKARTVCPNSPLWRTLVLQSPNTRKEKKPSLSSKTSTTILFCSITVDILLSLTLSRTWLEFLTVTWCPCILCSSTSPQTRANSPLVTLCIKTFNISPSDQQTIFVVLGLPWNGSIVEMDVLWLFLEPIRENCFLMNTPSGRLVEYSGN